MRQRHIGGNTNTETNQTKTYQFKRQLNTLLSTLSRENVNETANKLIDMFHTHSNKNTPINVLIPVNSDGKQHSKQEPIYDFVSPIIVLLNTFREKNIDGETPLSNILNAYYTAGGNFQLKSSRYGITPIDNELQHTPNYITLLVGTKYPFSIPLSSLPSDVKNKIGQMTTENGSLNTSKREVQNSTSTSTSINTHRITYSPSEMPQNHSNDYDPNVAPWFWKPLFKNENEMISMRRIFSSIIKPNTPIANKGIAYENDEPVACSILERIIPSYYYNRNGTSVINTANCAVCLFYGLLSALFYETNQDYLIMFKGGRAIQLALTTNADNNKHTQYFSEDTDISLFPNPYKSVPVPYNREKMKLLAIHIGLFTKWMFPELQIGTLLPDTIPNQINNNIVKVSYYIVTLPTEPIHKQKHKAIADIGFLNDYEGEKNSNNPNNYSLFKVYLNEFEKDAIFITHSLSIMLEDKMKYYAKYYFIKQQLERTTGNYVHDGIRYVNREQCDAYMYKFKKAINQLVTILLKKEYGQENDAIINKHSVAKQILTTALSTQTEYTTEQIAEVVSDFHFYDKFN